jgi:hypothetical protein
MKWLGLCFSVRDRYLYANLGDKQGAFKWLAVAYQDRDIGLMRLKTDFLLDSLRSDPPRSELNDEGRFPAVANKQTISGKHR